MEEPDDAELLAAATVGDDEAFAIFYRRHVDTVVAFLRRRVRDPEAAFDLTAETFAAAALGARRFRAGEAPAVAWLLGIARNKWLESIRRGRVEDAARRRLGLAPIEFEDADLQAVEARAAAGSGRLAELLAQLPPELRDALEERVVHERPYREIAAQLGCSEQLVRQRVHRGLRRLRSGLEESP